MRALWLVRANLEDHPGGDTTQILRTAASLRKFGISVSVSSEPKPDLHHVDIVHLFHLDRLWENSRWCHQIRASGIPSVLSPIYWPSDDFDRRGRTGFQGVMSRTVGGASYQNLRILQRAALPILAERDLTTLNRHMFNFRRSARYVLDTVDAILPNSELETEVLQQRFGHNLRFFEVPNAANSQTYGLPRSDNEADLNSVLCVGRIEPRKNQLTLIRALSNSDVHLCLVGQAGRFSHRYSRSCRREAGPNVSVLPWQSPTSLRKLYQSSRVHVSVSWYETPGLASLEAALSGCRLVVTPGGSTREYFGEDVDYCVPDDVESIRRAVRRALARPPSTALADRVSREYTWEVAASRTLAAYDYALKRTWRGDQIPQRRGSGATGESGTISTHTNVSEGLSPEA